MKVVAAQSPAAAELRKLLRGAAQWRLKIEGLPEVVVTVVCPKDTVHLLADPPETP
jgi:hypothetical protein